MLGGEDRPPLRRMPEDNEYEEQYLYDEDEVYEEEDYYNDDLFWEKPHQTTRWSPNSGGPPPKIINVKIVADPSRANEILKYLEEEGDADHYDTYNIERDGAQAVITGTVPEVMVDVLSKEFADATVSGAEAVSPAKKNPGKAPMSPPTMAAQGVSLETIANSVARGELSREELLALLVAIGFERDMTIGETRYALQLGDGQHWEWCEPSIASECGGPYAAVTKNATFGPHVDYHAKSAHGLPVPGYSASGSSRSDGHAELEARVTFAESDPRSSKAPVGYKAALGLSTGGGIKDDSISIKVLGTGISLGRNMSVSVLDSEVNADLKKGADELGSIMPEIQVPKLDVTPKLPLAKPSVTQPAKRIGYLPGEDGAGPSSAGADDYEEDGYADDDASVSYYAYEYDDRLAGSMPGRMPDADGDGDADADDATTTIIGSR